MTYRANKDGFESLKRAFEKSMAAAEESQDVLLVVCGTQDFFVREIKYVEPDILEFSGFVASGQSSTFIVADGKPFTVWIELFALSGTPRRETHFVDTTRL
ncbi:MAG TPA: hypothetical protein VKV04_14665 [Verrucomicrobiae bacterium]|nr:hypothetical protein [Verrucomicrobiae bacterium]